MKEDKKNRTKWLHVRLSEAEESRLKEKFQLTTETVLSDYIRKVILGKPMIKAVRDQSLQDVVAILSKLQKDLNGVANNFNQTVKKLHTYKEDTSIAATLLTLKLDEKNLLKAVTEMQSYIRQTHAKWLQE